MFVGTQLAIADTPATNLYGMCSILFGKPIYHERCTCVQYNKSKKGRRRMIIWLVKDRAEDREGLIGQLLLLEGILSWNQGCNEDVIQGSLTAFGFNDWLYLTLKKEKV